jgi:hypothetical protein
MSSPWILEAIKALAVLEMGTIPKYDLGIQHVMFEIAHSDVGVPPFQPFFPILHWHISCHNKLFISSNFPFSIFEIKLN